MIELAAILTEARALEAEGNDLLARHRRELDALVMRQRAESRAALARLARLAALVEAG